MFNMILKVILKLIIEIANKNYIYINIKREWKSLKCCNGIYYHIYRVLVHNKILSYKCWQKDQLTINVLLQNPPNRQPGDERRPSPEVREILDYLFARNADNVNDANGQPSGESNRRPEGRRPGGDGSQSEGSDAQGPRPANGESRQPGPNEGATEVSKNLRHGELIFPWSENERIFEPNAFLAWYLNKFISKA